MAYTALTFVYGEVLTATKMNALAANDASFHDGSGLPSITTSMLEDNAVTRAKIDSAILALGDYSTNEIDTGFTWINGKHIFKKTINFGQLPTDAYKNVDHGITNLDYIIEINTTAKSTLQHRYIGIPYGANSDIYAVVTNTYVQIGTSTDRSEFTECYMTLYYTKNITT